MIPLVLALLGCHVFETISVRCTSGMPCADPPDDDSGVDTAAPDDSGDSGVDTAVPNGEPVRGFVVSLTGGSGARVRVYDASAALRAQWNVGDATGRVAYDPSSRNAVVIGANVGYWLYPDETSAPAPSLDANVPVAVVASEGEFYAVARSGAARLSFGTRDYEIFYYDTTTTLLGAAAAPGGGLWATRLERGVDLFRLSPAEQTELRADFDTDTTRATMVFTGPDDAPYVCSTSGQPFAVEALARGVTTPAVVPSMELTDASACAYDPGDGSWMIFSPSVGVLRVAQDGTAEVIEAVPAGYSFVSANFY